MRLTDFGGWRAVLAAALAVLVLGCGKSGPPDPQRAVTFGVVHFGGKPVAEGQIRFIPDNAPTAGGPIREGKYRIEFKGGVPVGTCKVEIDAYEKSAERVVIGAGGKTAEDTRQIVPAKYNAQSTLSAKIEAGKENECDFDLHP